MNLFHEEYYLQFKWTPHSGIKYVRFQMNKFLPMKKVEYASLIWQVTDVCKQGAVDPEKSREETVSCLIKFVQVGTSGLLRFKLAILPVMDFLLS